MIGIGEQVYSILLLSVFFLEVMYIYIYIYIYLILLYMYSEIPLVFACILISKWICLDMQWTKFHIVIIYHLNVSNCWWCIQVYATGFIPYIGNLLNFLLLSWMYAYYCFEYVVHIHLCLKSSLYCSVDDLQHAFLIGTNGISMKWLWTKGWTTSNLAGLFLLDLVIFSLQLPFTNICI